MNRYSFLLTSAFALSLAALPGCSSDENDAEPTQAGSCTIIDKGDGLSAIRCPDGSEIVVKNGTNGAPGEDGKSGKDGAQGSNGKDGKDGKDPSPCTLTDNADGTKSLTCGTTSVVIGDNCEQGFPADVVVTDSENEQAVLLTLFQVTSCTWVRGNVIVIDYSGETLPKVLERIEQVDARVLIGWDGGSDPFFAGNSYGGALTAVSFPNLKTVGEDLIFNSIGALEKIDGFTALEHVGGRLGVWSHPELASVGDFPALKSVGSLDFYDSPKLVSIGNFPELVTIEGKMIWESDAALTDLGTFPKLESVGSMEVLSNDALTILADFPALETIEGALTIANNQELTSVEGLAAVQSIGGDVSILNNPKLPACQVQNLFDSVPEIEGDITIDDNDDAATCP